MTKEELVAVVDRAHALWNQSGFTPRELKAIHEAWWDLLFDLDQATVLAALRNRALQEGHPPRPAEVRRLSLEMSNEDFAPSPAEAWGQLRDAAARLEHGLAPDNPLHPMVRKTIDKLGGAAALNMYTNKDRDLFMSEYAKMWMRRWEAADSAADHSI